jgi:hypothetical protein
MRFYRQNIYYSIHFILFGLDYKTFITAASIIASLKSLLTNKAIIEILAPGSLSHHGKTIK